MKTRTKRAFRGVYKPLVPAYRRQLFRARSRLRTRALSLPRNPRVENRRGADDARARRSAVFNLKHVLRARARSMLSRPRLSEGRVT